MLSLEIFKKLYQDIQGQQAVENLVLLAVLVVGLAATLFKILPSMGEGFMAMAKVIGGPIP